MTKYDFIIYGNISNKETDRFIEFVSKKYFQLTQDKITFTYGTIIATATLKTKKKLEKSQLEYTRFMIEQEFKKKFSTVEVQVKTFDK